MFIQHYITWQYDSGITNDSFHFRSSILSFVQGVHAVDNRDDCYNVKIYRNIRVRSILVFVFLVTIQYILSVERTEKKRTLPNCCTYTGSCMSWHFINIKINETS